MTGESQVKSAKRAALYVDGFNLYHPIEQIGNIAHLKWVSLWRLGEILCEHQQHQLVKVAFCTALPTHKPASHARHLIFNDAQRSCGVEVAEGHYVPAGTGHAEKQTDINVALTVILDGLDNVYDVAYLLTADTDQVATARFFKERLASKGKELIGVGPLTRKAPKDFTQLGVKRIRLNQYQLKQCLLPQQIQFGEAVLVRPPEYDPPA
jgi:hypothetical protein